MKIRLSLIFIILAIHCGCITRNVWRENDPNGFVEVTMEVFNTEMKGKIQVPYYVVGNWVYVKRNGILKYKAYAVRIFTTPFTITLDTVSFGVIGALYTTGVAGNEVATNPKAAIEMGRAIK